MTELSGNSGELKPCPFCGSPGKIEYMPERSRIYPHFPMCGRCSVMLGGRETDKKAVAMWNTRPVEDALRAELEGLRAQWASVPWEEIERSAELSGNEHLFAWLNQFQPRREATE